MSNKYNKEENFISAVVYVNNSESNLEYFLTNLISILKENFKKIEIVCVNDFSKDNSLNIIKQIGENLKDINLSVINMSYYHGVEASMVAGVDLSIGDFVFEFDSVYADYDFKEIMNVYRLALKGSDIVRAVPKNNKDTKANFFYFLFNKFSNLEYKIYRESFRILSRRAINRINSLNPNITYRKPVYAKCGLKMDTIKYDVNKTFKEKRGEEGYRFQLAIDSLILFTNVGYNFSIFITILMLLVTIFMVIYVIVIRFLKNPVEGWTTTILFLSLSFFGLFSILTLVLKHLNIIINLLHNKKNYTFESIIKLTK